MEPARRLEDLIVWQLGTQLRDRIFEMTESGKVLRNQRLRNQIRDSSASVPANVAEGFGRYRPKQNAYYVRIAKGSLAETQNHLLDGKRRKYWKADDFTTGWRLSCRAMKAIVPYLLYLEKCDENGPPPKEAPPDEERRQT